MKMPSPADPDPSIRCNLCGSTRYFLVYRRPADREKQAAFSKGYTISECHLEKPDKIVRCMTCDLVFAVPDGSAGEIIKDYEEMVDQDYIREEEGRRAQSRIILARIAKAKTGGKLLDIGCGPGFFLDEAKRLGWQPMGVDLSGWARDYAKSHFGIDVFPGALAAANFPDRSFDAITMSDVIEHLEDPKAMLKEIRRILKNDGILYVSTPDIESVLSRWLGARWWGINKHHLYYFSKRTIEKLFSEVGFTPLRYSSYPRVFSFGYWAKRLEAYPWFVRAPFGWMAGAGGLKDKLLTIVLHDQIGVIAKKVQRLDSVSGNESLGRPAGLTPRKVIAVLPAYNAAKTLKRTVADIPKDMVNEIILVDDASRDDTVKIAKEIGLTVYAHSTNRGYGGNQKTCYTKALEHGADIVVMVHPDYQYDPTVIPQLIAPILEGRVDAVFGSRMMKGGALEGGMPPWKHNANILLTAFENVMLGTFLTEFHSGFRAYSGKLLKRVNFRANSDSFIFDTQIIVQILAARLKIDEIPIKTRYFEEASSIRLWPSILYGLGILKEMTTYFLHARGIIRVKRFEPLEPGDA